MKKCKKYRSLPPEISRTEIPRALFRISSLIASIQKSPEKKRLFEALREEHLLQSFHSTCYAIPFPFLWLNCMKSDGLVLFGTQMELVGDSTLKTSIHVSYPIGFNLEDEILDGLIHVFRYELIPRPLIACCSPKSMRIDDMLRQFKKRESHLDHVGKTLYKALGICENIVQDNQTENCP